MKTILKTNTMIMLAAVFMMYTGCSPAALSENTVAPTENSSNIFGGQSSTQTFQNQNGIVGLIITTLDVLSGEEFTSLCTGTLIARRMVLTAAHCVASSPRERVVSVLAYFKPDVNTVTQNDVIAANGRAVHPQYMVGVTEDSTVDSVAWNDIALVRLSKNAPANIKVTPIAKGNSVLTTAGSQLLLSGFGISTPIVRKKIFNEKTKAWDVVEVRETNPTSGVLRQVENISVVQVLNNSKELLLNQKDSKGACHGDSGGPAFLKQANGTVIQVGVTSRGTNELGNCDEQAIYTSVAAYSTWIETTMGGLIPASQFNPNAQVTVQLPSQQAANP